MTYVAILILMLVAFTAVGWPLISSNRAARREARASQPLEDLISERDTAYQAIQELDFEHQLGNLSESDYRSLRERYRSQAAAVLQRLDVAVKETATGGAAPTGRTATAVASPASPLPGLPCPSCTQPIEAADRYCWSCGARLGARCASCGGAVQAGDRFCGSCGAPLETQA